MADFELRQRRVGQEVQETRRKQRAERVYKIEKKPEPSKFFDFIRHLVVKIFHTNDSSLLFSANWWIIVSILVFTIAAVIFFLKLWK